MSGADGYQNDTSAQPLRTEGKSYSQHLRQLNTGAAHRQYPSITNLVVQFILLHITWPKPTLASHSQLHLSALRLKQRLSCTTILNHAETYSAALSCSLFIIMALSRVDLDLCSLLG